MQALGNEREKVTVFLSGKDEKKSACKRVNASDDLLLLLCVRGNVHEMEKEIMR